VGVYHYHFNVNVPNTRLVQFVPYIRNLPGEETQKYEKLYTVMIDFFSLSV
jgi:hypothetical protein